MTTKQILQNMEKEFRNTKFAKSGGLCFECCEYEEMWDDLIVFYKDYTRTLLESFGEEIMNKLETEIDVVLDSEVVKNANVTRECIDGTFTHTRLKVKEIISSIGK